MERVKMTKMNGVANVLPEDVEVWKNAGWIISKSAKKAAKAK